MSDVTAIVCTYGDRRYWDPLATRAVASLLKQTVMPSIKRVHYDDETRIGPVRHRAAAAVTTKWLMFLDADDEVNARYVQCSLAGTGDIRQPQSFVPGDQPAFLPANDSLADGNWIVVGAMCRTSLYHQVGGYRDKQPVEDWDLWCRMTLAGAELGQAPGAYYLIHRRERSISSDTVESDRLFTALRQELYGL